MHPCVARRSFRPGVVLLAVGLALSSIRGVSKAEPQAARPHRNPDIKYVNPLLPNFHLPPFPGQRYQDRVPDTLDLAERASQAVHALTATTDADANADIYAWTCFGAKPPILVHNMSDGCEFKYYAASVLLRQACGSKEHMDVEWHRMANLLQMQGSDGLATFHRMTRFQPALELARKLAKFYQPGHSGFVGSKGEFQNNHANTRLEEWKGEIHFQTNSGIRMCMLDAGIQSGDRALVETAQRGYEFRRARGDVQSGFFPELLNVQAGAYGNTCEMCCTADMLYLALRQSTSRQADRCDDVDRWVRNLFAEGQLLRTDWIQAFSDRSAPFSRPYATTRDVAQRMKGGWGGYIVPNEWQGNAVHSTMPCCVGNSAMQLFRVWRDIIEIDPHRGRLTIHLLLNRASAWADVHSHIPYRGLVEVRLKRDCEVALRIPEWTKPQDCRVRCGDKETAPSWEGRYAVVRGHKGEVVCLECPIRERSEKVHIGGADYQFLIRGNEIVDVTPKGRLCPLFERAGYRQNETRWRNVERFVSDTVVKGY